MAAVMLTIIEDACFTSSYATVSEYTGEFYYATQKSLQKKCLQVEQSQKSSKFVEKDNLQSHPDFTSFIFIYDCCTMLSNKNK